MAWVSSAWAALSMGACLAAMGPESWLFRAPLPSDLPLANGGDGGGLCGGVRGRLAPVREHFLGQAGQPELHVDAVQQGAGDARLVGLHVARLAAAGALDADPPRRAGVHGGDELEVGGIGDPVVGAGYGGLLGFKRLAQQVQHPGLEVRHLV